MSMDQTPTAPAASTEKSSFVRKGRKKGIPNGSRTAEVLQFIFAEVYEGRPFPSASQINQHMGWKVLQSANDTLLRLMDQGHVVRTSVCSRISPFKRHEYHLVPGVVSQRNVDRSKEAERADASMNQFACSSPDLSGKSRGAA